MMLRPPLTTLTLFLPESWWSADRLLFAAGGVMVLLRKRPEKCARFSVAGARVCLVLSAERDGRKYEQGSSGGCRERYHTLPCVRCVCTSAGVDRLLLNGMFYG